MPQVHELRANLTAASAATAKAQQQADTAHAELAKLPSKSPAVEAELQELRVQLRSAQNLAAQHQQEAMLSRYRMAQCKSNCMATTQLSTLPFLNIRAVLQVTAPTTFTAEHASVHCGANA